MAEAVGPTSKEDCAGESTLQQAPLALYVHLPWCIRKCPYCDFNSYRASASLPEDEYVSGLLGELEVYAASVRETPIQSVFFGGGTPSLFAPDSIARILEGVRRSLNLAEPVEITLEANPGTVEQGRFNGFRDAGCNRLSIGAQSFDDTLLERLGRIHRGSQVVKAVHAARRAGFENVNLDLMWGLPGQTREQAHRDLIVALDLEPEHLSYYQLTLEPGTPFYAEPPPLPREDEQEAMQSQAGVMMSERGYTQYEVSAYARRGWRCRHNLNYWMFGDYLGVGAGAHGKWTDVGGGQIWRTEVLRRPREYLERLAHGRSVVTRRCVAPPDRRFEFMLNALRLRDGFPSELYEVRTGLSWEAVLPILRRAESDGLMALAGEWVRPTERGHRFLNELMLRFTPDGGAP